MLIGRALVVGNYNLLGHVPMKKIVKTLISQSEYTLDDKSYISEARHKLSTATATPLPLSLPLSLPLHPLFWVGGVVLFFLFFKKKHTFCVKSNTTHTHCCWCMQPQYFKNSKIEFIIIWHNLLWCVVIFSRHALHRRKPWSRPESKEGWSYAKIGHALLTRHSDSAAGCFCCDLRRILDVGMEGTCARHQMTSAVSKL